MVLNSLPNLTNTQFNLSIRLAVIRGKSRISIRFDSMETVRDHIMSSIVRKLMCWAFYMCRCSTAPLICLCDFAFCYATFAKIPPIQFTTSVASTNAALMNFGFTHGHLIVWWVRDNVTLMMRFYSAQEASRCAQHMKHVMNLHCRWICIADEFVLAIA